MFVLVPHSALGVSRGRGLPSLLSLRVFPMVHGTEPGEKPVCPIFLEPAWVLHNFYDAQVEGSSRQAAVFYWKEKFSSSFSQM